MFQGSWVTNGWKGFRGGERFLGINYLLFQISSYSSFPLALLSVPRQRTSSELSLGCLLSKNQHSKDKSFWESFLSLGKPAIWDDGGLMSQKPSSPSRVKGKAWKRGQGYVREKQVPRQVFLCLHDPKQTCWHQQQLFSNIARLCLLWKSGPSSLKASGLQISRILGKLCYRPRNLGQQAKRA